MDDTWFDGSQAILRCMNISIKLATIECIEDLIPLFDDYRTFHRQVSDIEGAKVYLSERLKADDATIYIAYNDQDNVPVGYTYLYKIYSNHSMRPVVILNDLYIHEAVRGKGIGQLLIQKAMDYAKETGAKSLGLSAFSDNLPAKQLYEYLGFVKESGFDHFSLEL